MRDFHLPGRSAVMAANGMAATSHPLASLTAIEILRAGGNAADAAIAAAMVLNIAEPHMCGLGGDCFVLVKPAGSETIAALNGSGRAPAALSAEGLRAAGHRRMPLHDVASVTMPGAVDAFCRLSAEFGRLGLERILAPAIRCADEGVPVAPRVALDWPRDAEHLRGDARRFYLIDGKAPGSGRIFRAPGQAEVLRRIARQGRAGFYEGEVAEDMISSLRALGGVHGLDDLARTAAEWGGPVTGNYRGWEIAEHPPNGQGAAAITLLNILARFDLASLPPDGAARAHLEAEATKLALEARDRLIADAGSMAPDACATLLSPGTAAGLAARIDPGRAGPAPVPPEEATHRDTICLSVVDRDRMAVSLIYSTYWGFGSGLASSRFGINFHNRGAGFSLRPGHPNEAGGGKRPMHTIIPAMLCRQGRVVMPFGVMGGDYQPTGHARLVTGMVDYGMELQQAIDAPRCFAGPGGLELERGHAPGVAQELARMGHRVTIPVAPLGGAQAIVIGEDGLLTGGSDPRKDGCALGF